LAADRLGTGTFKPGSAPIRAIAQTISAIEARSRGPDRVVTSMLSITARAPFGISTDAFAAPAVCRGPRTDRAGFT
jgi:hypothetical protein